MPGTAHGARPHGVRAHAVRAHGADPTHAVHLLEAVVTVAGLAIVAGGAILSAVRRPGRRAVRRA
jgi:hypothetical protein